MDSVEQASDGMSGLLITSSILSIIVALVLFLAKLFSKRSLKLVEYLISYRLTIKGFIDIVDKLLSFRNIEFMPTVSMIQGSTRSSKLNGVCFVFAVNVGNNQVNDSGRRI